MGLHFIIKSKCLLRSLVDRVHVAEHLRFSRAQFKLEAECAILLHSSRFGRNSLDRNRLAVLRLEEQDRASLIEMNLVIRLPSIVGGSGCAADPRSRSL